MAYSSFAQFVQALDQAGELTRVSIPVETDLLIAEWADREMKSPGGGKALLFEQPLIDGKPSKFPLAINTMGSQRRMALALKVENVDEISREIQLILKAKPPTDLREGWSLLKQGIHLLHARPKSRQGRRMSGSGASLRRWRAGDVVARSAHSKMLAERRRKIYHAAERAHA